MEKKEPYVHRCVQGLPASLIAKEGKTCAAIALMQRHAGLNRETRRGLSGIKIFKDVSAAIGADLPKSEMNLLSYYLSAGKRSGAFWHVVTKLRDRNGARGTEAYAFALDVQLLAAYAPDWNDLTLDEPALAAACPEWPVIRDRLEDAVKRIVKQPPLGLFMLWPRLCDDLGRWDTLDAERQQIVGRAIFSLSSVSWTDWFIREAIGRCPELEPELGKLLKRHEDTLPTQEEAPLSEPTELPDQNKEPARLWKEAWPGLLDRLEALVKSLREAPNKQAVADLAHLCNEFEVAAAQMPDESSAALADLGTKIAELVAICRGLQGGSEFEWLDDSLLEQIEVRWFDSRHQAIANDGVAALTDEAICAAARIRDAAELYRAAWVQRSAVEIQVEASRAVLATARSMAERRVAERRKTEHQQALINAEAAIPTLQDALLAAASPEGATFDHDVDYRLSARGVVGAVDLPDAAAASDRAESSDLDGETITATPGELLAVRIIEGEVRAQALDSSDADVVSDEVPVLGLSVQEPSALAAQIQHEPDSPKAEAPPATRDFSVAPQVTQNGADEDAYSVDVGEACRPVWALLKQGHLSLAFQLSRALSEGDGALKVPPPELLASVALANQLVLPDGGVKELLAENLAKLSADTFVQQGPRAWHTALNLLLVAGTLRPMILVPDVGASSIAGYLHLDAKYPELYSLVQQLRHFSDLLQGFRIEPATLKLARDEAGIQLDLQSLEREARDWLTVQAPAVTIRYAPATKVWLYWLKPQGVVSQLVAPVMSNRLGDLQGVKELIVKMSDASDFPRIVRDTDRKDLRRTRGEDIHAGALQHLARCAEGAVAIARRWVTLVEANGQTADRVRSLLQDVRTVLLSKLRPLESELRCEEDGDSWGLISAAQSVVLSELRAMWSLFDPAVKLPPAEPTAAEVLARDVLLVPQLRLADDWRVSTERVVAIAAMSDWARHPNDWCNAFDARVHDGDLYGAELILQAQEDLAMKHGWQSELRRELESWRAAFRRVTDDARREVEVGSAYGYLSDSDRGSIESELVRWEVKVEQTLRFDEATSAVTTFRQTVLRNRDEQTAVVQRSLAELSRSPENEAGIEEVAKVLAQGDIATANELLQRLRAGLPAWPEDNRLPDKFNEFFPAGMQALESWLDAQRSRDLVESVIKNGQSVPSLDFRKVAGAQRDQAAKMFAAWSDLKSRKQVEANRLETLMAGLGFVVQRLTVSERKSGRELWEVDSASLEDRSLCPIPQFGSSAKGKYRLVCVWERPTEDAILQVVGESTLQRATIVLYFGRMTDRKWRDTSRLAKTSRKSFLLIDEVMLVYLCAQAGSRLSALFDLALPFSYSTPYDATAGLVPPEMFYGRSAELDAVRGLNGRCFIYGGRQLGKTALLRRAELSFHAPAARRYSRWVDLRAEGIGVSREASDLWVCLTEQLKSINVFSTSVAVPTPSKKGSVEAVVSELRRFLGDDSDRRVLLLLDEADRFFEQDGRNDFAETRRLKQLMDDTGRRFKVVFAGLHNVLRMTERANHPLAHFGEPIKIGPFVDEHEVREAEDLVRRPMEAAGFEFETRSLVIRILAQTNYYPSLIQLYCSHLLRHMLSRLGGSQRPAGPRYRITDRDIETVYSSGALREEIRSKFRLTLQLDPRYEVVAYALALDALRGRYAHNDGMDWQSIRQAGAMYWWPEGFHDTSELDFRVLLDEMVELGVLSRLREGRYTLRNPNVLLLLGSQEEIEAVLIKDREPTVEFESAIFRPPLRSEPASPRRNPLTYQQLSELMRRSNTITAIAGSRAGGVEDLVPGLQDYLGQSASFVLLDDCSDRASFSRSLDRELKGRTTDGITVILVPCSVPWSALWVQDAKQKLALLRHSSKFVSLVFVADPLTLWGAISDETTFAGMDVPWMSLLPWTDEFVRHWLEERQLPNDVEQRKQILQVTGFWAGLLQEIVAQCTEARELKRRIEAADLSSLTGEAATRYAAELGLSFHEPHLVLKTLTMWGDPVEPDELAIVAECDLKEVNRVLRWADLLGLARRGGGDFWSLDPLVKAIFQKLDD
ncbi:MAG: ATP-binding protein [Candidatus Accumulibacter phosphatis]